jgi:hypothetical protein
MFDLQTIARLNAEAEKKHFEAKDKTIQEFLKNNIVIVAPRLNRATTMFW